MEQRKDARFPVQFRSSFSSANLVSGEGSLRDLSIRGCRVFSSIEVKPGTALLLRVQAFTDQSPIQISQAIVRWCRASSFGCEFVSLSPDEWARLHYLIKDLEKEPFERQQEDTEAV
ncbi:MAG: PilZ domain-containing protein [Nitrospirae bacterium]|nr:PilZ domain-containing protein [Nitrospirota bacterium]